MLIKHYSVIMVFLILTAFHHAEGQTGNSLTEQNLNGQVKSLKTTCFGVKDSSGMFVSNGGILYSHAPVAILSFDQEGYLKEKTSFDSDTGYVKHLFEYNERMQVIEEIVWSPDGFIREVTFHSYDDNGLPEKCEHKVISRNEKLTVKEDFMKVRGTFRKRVFMHDEKGRQTSENLYDAFGCRTIVYTSDNKGNLTGHKYYNDEGKTVKNLVFTFDSKGNPLTCEESGSDGTLQNRTVYKYDEQFNLTEETVFDAGGSVTGSVRHEFEYDGRKNWVRRLTIRNGEPEVITLREIEYY